MVFNGPPDVKGCGFGKSLSNTSLPTVHRAQLLNLCVYQASVQMYVYALFNVYTLAVSQSKNELPN